jgi:alpha-tubulin suppressor-like RCC1 family protein
MPNEFLSPEGDLENYFVSEYWLIDQYIGDELWTWGFNDNGRLGNANTVDVSTPATTFSGGTDWKQVSSGGNHTTAIKTDGTLWAWGSGDNGRLGNANTVDVSTPVTTFAGGVNWKFLSAGGGHITAIKTDGTLWAWGSGANGRLGNANTVDVSTPVTTFTGGTNWKQVSAGDASTSAIKIDGTLWVWGTGANGRLGNADTTDISTPVTTFSGGTNWKQVNSGNAHIAAIKTDGTLWTWGSGINGRLGNGVTTGNISTPVTTFSGGTNWKQVSAGDVHTAAIKTDGTLWTWGNGGNGRLGNSIIIGTISTPITTFTGGTNWKQVSAGDAYTSAIKIDGTLWTWGLGANGRLGTNDITSRSTPVTTFAGGTNWKQLSSGTSHIAAVTSGIPADLPLS